MRTARSYVGYDEFTADRRANRLIHLAVRQMVGRASSGQSTASPPVTHIVFVDVPTSTN